VKVKEGGRKAYIINTKQQTVVGLKSGGGDEGLEEVLTRPGYPPTVMEKKKTWSGV
jgi:hypothetical protein